MTTDELMAMVDGLCEAAYSAQDTDALRASLRAALEAVVEGCRQETAPVQGLTDEQIDAIAAPWLAPDGQANDSDVRQIVRAALAAAPHAAAPVVAWRVRGYAQFKTGKPGPWRYFDGPTTPAVNTPDCCDIEPLYAATPALRHCTDCGEGVTLFCRAPVPVDCKLFPSAPASDADSMQGSQPTGDAA